MSSTSVSPPPAASGTPTCATTSEHGAERTDTDELPAASAAAIHDDGDVDVDALLAGIAGAQRRAGRRVHGLVMTYPDTHAGRAGDMVLVDVHTGEPYLVSQRLGRGSGSCRSDPQGFARASRVLRDALAQSPDLVVCNRFGGLEIEGGGFSAELLELMSRGVPLLTVVATPYLEAWQRFTGGAEVLPAQPAAISQWLALVLPDGSEKPDATSPSAPDARG